MIIFDHNMNPKERYFLADLPDQSSPTNLSHDQHINLMVEYNVTRLIEPTKVIFFQFGHHNWAVEF